MLKLSDHPIRGLNPNQVITRTALLNRDALNHDAREFTGIGVPWNQVIEHWFGREAFDRGSVETEGAGPVLLLNHHDAVGTIPTITDTDEGCQITGRISDTTLGRDAWVLVRDGVLKLSIGFEPLEYRVDEDDVIHWTRVIAREFSLVPVPAYSGATIDPASLRNQLQKENHPMHTDGITNDIAAIREQLDDQARDIARLTLGVAPAPGHAADQWRTIGDYVKAVAAGDDAAIEFHRAYTGATTADTMMKDTFIGDYIQLVDDRRKLVESFTRGTLPAEGLSVDYVKLKEDATKVAAQAKEGDDLSEGKVNLESANAKVATWGGWTQLSRQAIERATVPALNITLRALALRYAKVTNTAVRKAFLDQVAANITADASDDTSAIDIGATLNAATPDQWLDTIVDAALTLEDCGFALDALHVSRDVFKALRRLKDGDRRLMTVYGTGINIIGELDLVKVDGNLGNVPVKVLPGTDITGKAAFADKIAIEFLESPGAPAQLQDENIINLSKSFSIYGYGTVLVPFPTAILPIEFA